LNFAKHDITVLMLIAGVYYLISEWPQLKELHKWQSASRYTVDSIVKVKEDFITHNTTILALVGITLALQCIAVFTHSMSKKKTPTMVKPKDE